MTIQAKGPVLATIVGFGAIILIIAGLMMGWKWVAPATEEEVKTEMTTGAVVVASDVIEVIESMPKLEGWTLSLEYDGYKMSLDFGEEDYWFRNREDVIDFYKDIESVSRARK